MTSILEKLLQNRPQENAGSDTGVSKVKGQHPATSKEVRTALDGAAPPPPRGTANHKTTRGSERRHRHSDPAPVNRHRNITKGDKTSTPGGHGMARRGDICMEDLLERLQGLRSDKGQEGEGEEEETSRTKKSLKLERTTSLPPFSQHGIQQTPYLDNTDDRGRHGLGGACTRPLSRSHGDGEYRRDLERQRLGREGHGNRTVNRYHFGHAHRKHKRRTRSDGKPEVGGACLVDMSLDDDCPGVTMVRKPVRHHSRSSKGKGKGGVAGSEDRGKRGGGGGVSGRREGVDTGPEHEAWSTEVNTNFPVRAGGSRGHSRPTDSHGAGVGKGHPKLVMTLENLQKAALILEKSTEFESTSGGEGLQSRGEEEELHGGSDEHDHSQVHPSHTQHFVCHASTSERDFMSGSGRAEADYSWRDHAPRFSRNGRESPATDMAVANLDLDSERMLRPLNSLSGDVVGSQCVRCEEATLVRHMHFHSAHHHYHHIICHHSQP